MNALSLRSRLTVWYTLALLAILSVAAAAVLWQQQRIALRRVDGELASLAETVANVLRDEVRENTPRPAQEAVDTIGIRDHAVAILDRDGGTLGASWNGLDESLAQRERGEIERGRTVAGSGPAWRLYSRREVIAGVTYVVLVAGPLAAVERERREAEEAVAVGIPLALVLAALGGLWLASVGLRPIAALAERAARRSPDAPHDLGESGRSDELGTFARAFNDLVARLRTTLQTQRRFMADASHELRTPVSVIRSAADVTLARETRDESEYREALAIVRDQGQRLTRLVDDMLVLARADTGAYPLQRTHVAVDEIVADCVRTVGVFAADRGVGVRTTAAPDAALDGDEDLLRRMLLNVVQNAVQFTPSGGGVSIDIVPNGQTIAIDVTNDGSPIPSAERERIFDRFVQLDPARRASGSGLGLPIARWIAEAHGGTLCLHDSGAQRTTFRFVLPTETR